MRLPSVPSSSVSRTLFVIHDLRASGSGVGASATRLDDVKTCGVWRRVVLPLAYDVETRSHDGLTVVLELMPGVSVLGSDMAVVLLDDSHFPEVEIGSPVGGFVEPYR